MGIADDVKNLSADIAASYDARIKAIGTIVKETQTGAKNTHAMLKGFGAEHKDMAADLKANLKKSTGDIQTYVKNKLREFCDAHAEMSDELNKDLAKYVAEIVNGTREMLGAFHGERERMGAHWQAMAATLAQKRGTKPVEAEAGADVKTVDKAVAKPKNWKRGRKPAKKG